MCMFNFCINKRQCTLQMGLVTLRPQEVFVRWLAMTCIQLPCSMQYLFEVWKPSVKVIMHIWPDLALAVLTSSLVMDFFQFQTKAASVQQ
jgi:hypothetical protein